MSDVTFNHGQQQPTWPPSEPTMQRMTAELYECLSKAESLGAQIKSNLKGLGYGG